MGGSDRRPCLGEVAGLMGLADRLCPCLGDTKGELGVGFGVVALISSGILAVFILL